MFDFDTTPCDSVLDDPSVDICEDGESTTDVDMHSPATFEGVSSTSSRDIIDMSDATINGPHNISFKGRLEDDLKELDKLKEEIRQSAPSQEERLANLERHYDSMRADLEAGIELGFKVLDDMESNHPDDWKDRAQRNLDSEARRREAQEYMEHALQAKREEDYKLEFNLTDDQYKAIKDGYQQVYPQSHTYRLPDGDGNWFERDGNLYRLEENGTMTLRNENWREEISKAEIRDQKKIDDWMRLI